MLRTDIKRVLLAEAQHRRLHSAFGCTLPTDYLNENKISQDFHLIGKPLRVAVNL